MTNTEQLLQFAKSVAAVKPHDDVVDALNYALAQGSAWGWGTTFNPQPVFNFHLLMYADGTTKFFYYCTATKQGNYTAAHTFKERGYIPPRFRDAVKVLDAAADEHGNATVAGFGLRRRSKSDLASKTGVLTVEFVEYQFP